ncbi:hypothetical protein GCM10027341_53230 [Spirosoma knui]
MVTSIPVRPVGVVLLLISLFCSVSQVAVAQLTYPKAAKTRKAAKGPVTPSVRLRNFTADGKQLTRFDAVGDAIDAHDGEIAYFRGTYYLYGTSYDCGFAWQNKKAPFCGFKVYSSPDLVNWTDQGYLFDAKTPVWQTRCNGNTYGCFRPHVIFNQKTNQYVLWINVYDNRVGFRVFTSSSPTGPFKEVAEPTLAVNRDAPVAGLNNGDHDTFVDEDGTAYLAYTDWRAKGAIVIEQLTADYLSGTDRYVKSVTPEQTEAPGLFKRRGIYYITYSDPNCGYCSGTGTSYRTASSPLGPWSEGRKISDKSCGGQPSFVSTIQLANDSLFLYGSDLWNNAARNEALANYFWAPLTFSADGSIQPIACDQTPALSIRVGQPEKWMANRPTNRSVSDPSALDYTIDCDITNNHTQSQPFMASQTGLLSAVSLTAYKKDNPNAALEIAIFSEKDASDPTARPLYSTSLSADSISWAARNRFIRPNLRVSAGQRYVLRVSSAASVGCYGLAYAIGERSINLETPGHGKGDVSKANEAKRTLKFQTVIQATK